MGDACRQSVGGRHLFCAGCWRRLPRDLQARIGEAIAASAQHIAYSLAQQGRRWMVDHRPATIADRRIGAG